MKALITTIPFGDKDRLPLELLESSNVDYLINPLGKKLKEDDPALPHGYVFTIAMDRPVEI